MTANESTLAAGFSIYFDVASGTTFPWLVFPQNNEQQQNGPYGGVRSNRAELARLESGRQCSASRVVSRAIRSGYSPWRDCRPVFKFIATEIFWERAFL